MYEVIVGFPMPAWLYLPTAVAIGGGLWPRGAGRFRRERRIATGLLFGFILALYLVPWSTRKPFLKALDSIKPGMTAADARDRMAGYMEGSGIVVAGSRRPYMAAGALFFRHSDYIYMNADIGEVTIRNDRVVDVRFYPD